MFRARTPSANKQQAPQLSGSTSQSGESSTSPSPPPTRSKNRLGFSEIANLFIRLRRHQSRSSLASQTKKPNGPSPLANAEPSSSSSPARLTVPGLAAPAFSSSTPGPLAFPSTEPPSPTTTPAALPRRTSATDLRLDPSHPAPKALILTPPASPTRGNRVRRLTGGYTHPPTHSHTRSRFSSYSSSDAVHHNGIYSSSGLQPLTHPTLADTVVPGAPSLPVEYTDKFECTGGVTTATLLRATRKAMLDAIKKLGANALIDEHWECVIRGPKHGTYKVEIDYSANATCCNIPGGDSARPVAIDQAKGVPGLMSITKRNDVAF